MTMDEMKSAISFGLDMVETYKKNGEQVPCFVYDRLIELYDMLVEKQEALLSQK